MSALAASYKRVRAYHCQGCGEVYADEDDARDCCPPEEDLAFECPNPKCESGLHDTEEEVAECIRDFVCLCGDPKRWHAIQSFPGCYSPGCTCKKFEVTEER